MKPVLCIGVCLLSIYAVAQTATQKWQTRYDEVSRAIQARSLAKFSSYIAKDFTWVTSEGRTLDRKASIAEFSPIFKAEKITGGEKVLKVKEVGPFTYVTYEMMLMITEKGKKPTAFVDKGIDTWKRMKGRWLIVHTVSTPASK